MTPFLKWEMALERARGFFGAAAEKQKAHERVKLCGPDLFLAYAARPAEPEIQKAGDKSFGI